MAPPPDPLVTSALPAPLALFAPLAASPLAPPVALRRLADDSSESRGREREALDDDAPALADEDAAALEDESSAETQQLVVKVRVFPASLRTFVNDWL